MTELSVDELKAELDHPVKLDTDSTEFAREVRAERFALLWRVTLIAAGAVLLTNLPLSTLS